MPDFPQHAGLARACELPPSESLLPYTLTFQTRNKSSTIPSCTMALPMLINGADCGPVNPLQGLVKRFDQDRGIQQVRLELTK